MDLIVRSRQGLLVALCGLLALTLSRPSTGGQEHVGVTQLAEELQARSGPSFWGDTAGPLVRDRLRELSEQAASTRRGRWISSDASTPSRPTRSSTRTG